MYWNHRVVRTKSAGMESGYCYELVEVHYKDDGTPMAYTAPFMYGETVEEVQDLVDRLLKAVSQPVLNEEDFTTNEEV